MRYGVFLGFGIIGAALSFPLFQCQAAKDPQACKVETIVSTEKFEIGKETRGETPIWYFAIRNKADDGFQKVFQINKDGSTTVNELGVQMLRNSIEKSVP